ncbi:Crp/Fnr family transcriptional regulator [Adhaeribacter pallidiroseus]|uniref:Non-specific serine/threonine protein kinase n=1 Tax=Adhaeribacter pallidiroseus TaxID=2072847 RepID=A0A369QCR6_9BACT|nr:Crp/Fnr family transcriptional regulator [Adhaeribacter pallidiroseus]RDC62693.1 Non-specific serine/threonine protein kinase [Adhaeribacter pallidiroseus]
MSDPLLQLKKVIDALYPVPPADWEAFAGFWKPFTAKRKEVLTQAGEAEKYLYFVVEGVQRVFYYDEQNREATLVFTYAPSFGGVLDAFLLQQPSRYYYETLTPSVFLRAPAPELLALINQRSTLSYMIRQGLTNTLSGVLERLVELQCYSSEEKFKKLLQRSPHILQLVPHKYLANYLGIEATNFSKLINKVKI